ncbi:hypothetical protein KKI24_14595 [bacterium]|nr:hypothetical protein [bacterium]
MHEIFKRVIILTLLLSSSEFLYAQNRIQSVTNISFGSYFETHGDDQVNGTMLSIAYKRFFTEQWAYFVSLGNGSASGDHTNPDGSSVTLNSSRTSLSGGLKWHYYFSSKPGVIPYIGAGISIQQYAYDFDYVGSEIGTTTGTGYGPLLMAGVRIDVSRHFLIIPGYQFEQIYIESESGDQKVLTSSGLMLALVIRF